MDSKESKEIREEPKKKKTRKGWLIGLGISAAALIGTTVFVKKNKPKPKKKDEYNPDEDVFV